MAFRTDSPYIQNIYTVKQYGEHTIKISYCKNIREDGWEDERKKTKKGKANTEKLENNLSRARNTVREYVLCNPWDYWCTFTIDSKKYDRYNLDNFFKDFSMVINNYNKKNCSDCPEHKVKYVLVPEQHADGAWHLHGFIKGIRPKDLYTNEYGYLTWKQYEKKFGFISMDKIKDLDKASSYILKYMVKDADKNVTELGRHLYYASHGLQKAVELYRGKADYFGSWDWVHPDGYCKVKTVDLRTDSIYNYMELIQDDYTDVI